MTRRWAAALGWVLAAVLLALLAAAGLFVATFEPNDHRALVADAVSRAIGRDVAITGDLELAASLVPTLAVNAVTIGNPPSFERPVMASVGRLEATIALPPLLRERRIEIRRVLLERVDVALERDARNRPNWHFDPLADPRAAQQIARPSRAEIGEIVLDDVDVAYRRADGGAVAAHVDRLTLTRSSNGTLVIQAAGSLGTLPISLRWQAGPFAGREPRWPVAADIRVGDATLVASARLRAPLDYTGAVFEWEARSGAPSRLARNPAPRDRLRYALRGRFDTTTGLARIAALRGEVGYGDLPDVRIRAGRLELGRNERIGAAIEGSVAEQPFELSGEVDPRRRVVTGLDAAVAGITLAGELGIDDSAAPPVFSARLRFVDVTGLPARADGAAGPAWLERELPLRWLELGEVAVELDVAELRGLPFELRDAFASAELGDGTLRVSGFGARVRGRDVTGHGALSRADEAARVDVTLRAPGIELGDMHTTPTAGAAQWTGTAESASANLTATGSSARAALEAAEVELTAEAVTLAYASGTTAARAEMPALRVSIATAQPARLEAHGDFVAHSGARRVSAPFALTASSGTLAQWLQAERRWPATELTLDSRHRGERVRVAGRIADVAAIVRREASAVDAAVSWGPLEASVAGIVAPAARLAGTSADVGLAASDLAAAGELLGIRGLPAGPASVTAKAAIGERSSVFSAVNLALPGIDGTGDVSLDGRGDRTTARGQLELAELDLTPYLAVGAREPDADTAPMGLGRLIAALPALLAPLRAADLNLGATVAQARLGEFTSSGVRVGASAAGGVVDVDAALDGGRMTGHVHVDARTEAPVAELHLAADRVALVADRSGAPAPGTPVVDLTVDLSGRGAAAGAWAENLDGDVRLLLRGGRIEHGPLRFLFGAAIFQLLDVVNPFSHRTGAAEIDCAGANFVVRDGVAAAEKGIFMQTRDVQIVGTGTVDLVSGELAMRFQSKQRSGVVSLGGIVNEFVQMTGTVAAPRVELSPERAARTGFFAAVTGGLSLIAKNLFGRLSAQDACPQLPAILDE